MRKHELKKSPALNHCRGFGKFRACLLALGVLGILWGEISWVAAASGEKETPAAMIAIQIQPEASIANEKIYLEDIAHMQGDLALKEKIGRISLGPAPMPGKEKILSGKWIASIVDNGKQIPDTAQISIPESVTVKREFQTISAQRLEQLFKDYIASKADGGDFKINRFRIRGDKLFPPGKAVLKVLDGDRKKMKGHVNVMAAVSVDDKDCGNIVLSGWIDRYEKVVTARHPIPKDMVLTKEDLRLERMNISRAPANLIVSLDDAVGKQVKQPIREGAYLRSNQLEAPTLIQKGDKVKLVAKTGLLTVLTIGVAKSPGVKGEQIKVENLTSGKMVVGQVADESTVEVLF